LPADILLDAVLKGVPLALGIGLGRLGLVKKFTKIEKMLLASGRSLSSAGFHLAMNWAGVM
jgi:hypothetical protein